MSSVFKGIKKVFKKVVKVAKKVVPIVLAAAAVYFTAGAALGATATWGGAAAAATSSIGGTLGSVVTGAVTQAGYGAAIGGALSAASGGSFTQGAQAGALTGAITGGAGGLLRGPAPAAGTNTAKTFPLPDQPAVGAGQAIDAAGNPIGGAAGGVSAAAPGVAAPASSGGGLLSGAFKPGGWVERNQELIGGAVRGVGQGLLAGSAADADMDLIREKHNLVSGNYAGADPGAQYRSAAPGGSGQTPTERFDPKSYGSWEYQFDPKVGRIVRVPVGG